MIVKSLVNMNGPLSQANEIRFGLGSSMAVQQGIEVVDYTFFPTVHNQAGMRCTMIPQTHVVDVDLSFIGLDVSPLWLSQHWPNVDGYCQIRLKI